ncbi:MAG TPA: phosphoadenylyl-sulfate reductase [Acidimicrobiales bacterium]|nr:phosphoadenylyl-sulfate reductase [Acidimicrobiales bacterium]
MTSGFSSARELAEAAARLEGARAEEVLDWAVGNFGDALVVASSFQDCVLVDLAVRAKPDVEVVFIDTGFHFPETLDYLERVRRRLSLNLRVVAPELGPGTWPCGTAQCCQVRKVEPLARALAGKGAWVSGLRRQETPERRNAPVVSFDAKFGLVKVNPLVAWTHEQVDRYMVERGLPFHPLRFEGYVSIGCAPTTAPVVPGQDHRAGRWPGQLKTECGLHI